MHDSCSQSPKSAVDQNACCCKMLQQVLPIFKQTNSFVSLGKRYTVSCENFESDTNVIVRTVAE